MPRAQNSAKGRFAKTVIQVPTAGSLHFEAYHATTSLVSADSTGLVLAAGIKISNKAAGVITGNATGIVLVGGVKISNKQTLTANSTGYISSVVAAKPSARSAAKLAFYTNSTGINALMVNTTGTTWKFLRATATLNGTSGY